MGVRNGRGSRTERRVTIHRLFRLIRHHPRHLLRAILGRRIRTMTARRRVVVRSSGQRRSKSDRGHRALCMGELVEDGKLLYDRQVLCQPLGLIVHVGRDL